MNFRHLRISLAATLIVICATYGVSVRAQQSSTETNAGIPPQAILQPEELVQMLNTSAKPLVLQTGSHVLYAEAHIPPGSEYAGPAGTSAGIERSIARACRHRPQQATPLSLSIVGAAPGPVAPISDPLTSSYKRSGLRM